MRAAAERFARAWWAGELGSLGTGLGALAAPLSWAWWGASRLRARRHAGRGAHVEGLRVVSVGNLAVGGTGKSPVAAWIAGRLRGAGIPTAVLTGSHGRDEASLHERWNPRVPVHVGRDRTVAAARARSAGARIAVLDDGFQHFGLARDLDVVLLSADDPFPGHVLPRGPYREPASALARADVIVVTRRRATEGAARAVAASASARAPRAATAGAALTPLGLRSLASWVAGGRGGGCEDGAVPTGRSVLAVCAVARSAAFRESVADVTGGAVELLAFADHHAFGADDVARIRARAAGREVVITEKDAVKLARHGVDAQATLVLEEELRWSWGADVLGARLDALAEQGVRP